MRIQSTMLESFIITAGAGGTMDHGPWYVAPMAPLRDTTIIISQTGRSTRAPLCGANKGYNALYDGAKAGC